MEEDREERGASPGEPVVLTLREKVADGVHGLSRRARAAAHFFPVVSVTMPRFSMPMRLRRSSVSITVP